MNVTSAGLTLPWLEPVLHQAASLRQAHAVLLQGAVGDGLYEAARAISQAWLCEDVNGVQACGRCTACHLVGQGLHADLCLLLPEALRVQLGLTSVDGDEGSGDGGKATRRKPSRQIRIDDVRGLVDWIVTTSSRGRAKVALIHPAEALNVQAANALLKTLEEPPRGARLLLSCAEPSRLLPTLRSRCQVVRLQPPPAPAAAAWLATQGVADAAVLLAAASGRPLEAAALAAAGIDARAWTALPMAARAGQGAAVAGWPLTRVIDALQKLCHDGLALSHGAAPRFFPAASMPPPPPPSALALADWGRELNQIARRADHPWSEPLLVDALMQRAQRAWTAAPPSLARRLDTLAS